MASQHPSGVRSLRDLSQKSAVENLIASPDGTSQWSGLPWNLQQTIFQDVLTKHRALTEKVDDLPLADREALLGIDPNADFLVGITEAATPAWQCERMCTALEGRLKTFWSAPNATDVDTSSWTDPDQEHSSLWLRQGLSSDIVRFRLDRTRATPILDAQYVRSLRLGRLISPPLLLRRLRGLMNDAVVVEDKLTESAVTLTAQHGQGRLLLEFIHYRCIDFAFWGVEQGSRWAELLLNYLLSPIDCLRGARILKLVHRSDVGTVSSWKMMFLVIFIRMKLRRLHGVDERCLIGSRRKQSDVSASQPCAVSRYSPCFCQGEKRSENGHVFCYCSDVLFRLVTKNFPELTTLLLTSLHSSHAVLSAAAFITDTISKA